MIRNTIIISICSLIISAAFILKKDFLDPNESVSELLLKWGDEIPFHAISEQDTSAIREGREIVLYGFTFHDGKRSERVSKHFVCTDCHNTVQEDPVLNNPNPAARLEYAVEKGIPFLQGTTFYGMVNRESWYNDDYYKKYGDWVKDCQDTLVNAIQLCAKECSQGRYLESWELNAVLQYLWTLQYKISDLNLLQNELVNLSTAENTKRIKLLKSKYALKSPATFLDVQAINERKLGENGNAQNGKNIFASSCLHCHGYNSDVADLKLSTDPLTLNKFKRNLDKNNDFSLYYILRVGTPPDVGYKPYMPHYTAERLSDAQLEDLVAFILQKE